PHRVEHTLMQAWWGSDGELPLAAAELPVEHEERQPSEVIAVEVGDHYPAELIGLEPGPFQPHQGRGTAVDEDRLGASADVQARLEAAAAPESVSRAHKAKFDHAASTSVRL